ncbi:cupin domain-containing protein [Deferribacter autotrophicus]|uniref:Cupin domain-containing protein n=1 Tax=Deferribacter autotrophicus TaxID=500465 RepID=A0A5A8F3U0_9BACT|nr:cupin domain-containing protein [Deferribacter autotrophicus]KAA0258131.1 cupin domain-containing protein [Deferribacter autotrophicus]
MFLGHLKDMKEVPMNMEGAVKVFKKIAIGKDEGWDDYVMRVFRIEAGGHTPKHKHPWPHINYVIRGAGRLLIDGKDYSIEEGSVAFVPSNLVHQFKNDGNEDLELICIVPTKGEY